MKPCAGSTTAEVVDDDVIVLSVDNETGRVGRTKTRRNESVDWSDTLMTLANQTFKLRQRVRAVKKLYVSVTSLFLLQFFGEKGVTPSHYEMLEINFTLALETVGEAWKSDGRRSRKCK